MNLVFKALLGAAVVVLIAVLSRSRVYFIAGLVPLFPTFALIAHYIVGTERSAADLKTTALFGMWAVVPYLVYLIAVYLLVDRLNLILTLLSATLLWCVAAGMLILAWTRLNGSGT